MATSQSKIGAGVAGASGGTGLLALLNATIHDGNPWKPVFVYACPTVSVIIGAVYLYISRYLSDVIVERRLAAEISKAERALQDIEADPGSLAKTKKDARTKLEALRILKMELHTKRARAIVQG